jgi:hypothetical protein
MVNKPTQQDIPAYVSPLTHDEHAQIGRIAVLWGQIDSFVDSLLTFVLGIPVELRSELFADKQIGAKLDALRKFAPKLKPAERREQVQKFVRMIDAAKAERNQCFHGAWGFRITNKQTVIAAAQHYKQPEVPFKASSLPKLERQLCQTSHQGALAMVVFEQSMPINGAQPLFHGALEHIVDQEWFQEWLKRYYEDRHIQDHRWKPGRLPFLERPLE